MTNCKKTKPAPATIAVRGIVIGAVAASLAGCGMISSVVGGDKVDYKSVKKAGTLDVPPDLTQLQQDNRYSLPDAKNGVATASGYNAQRNATAGTPVVVGADGVVGVVPVTAGGVKVERAGNQRWLVVKQSPEVLWPQLKQFWEDSGFTIAVDQPTAGIMETEWNENRAKVPQDFIRSTIGKAFDSLYSTGEKDKFRTRVERLADGSTEIYISHRGVEEVVTGRDKETTTWTARPNDPGLEAQFLAKLMTRLGAASDDAQAKTAVDAAIVQPQHAKLVGDAATQTRGIEVDEGFDRAWRRVGLALDRVGFTVEDRDRTQGTYFVRYVDPDAVKKDGFFSKLFSWGSSSDKDKEAQRYRVLVKAGTGSTSLVSILSNEGKPDTSPVAEKILGLLNDQLK
ncbi:outer membrane protein assembly factor BamC [Janthinobacterium sp.]|jgi:outer membrane protein assembly factor BamC|uniref:outer membrane protein assembly factor BamC n=1 Tax=unclassified Janthinobacterium TaxID=2610881 RepID=UPI002DB8088E|nr:outer membrane protein assembly factor BamC [Janthinobacterium sp.]HEU4815593.1 outer membrane protein assembly factor BamC [Janthinobacterium sp.]